MQVFGPLPGSPPPLALNHKTRVCKHCRLHRSTKQYALATDEYCNKCVLRGYGVNTVKEAA